MTKPKVVGKYVPISKFTITSQNTNQTQNQTQTQASAQVGGVHVSNMTSLGKTSAWNKTSARSGTGGSLSESVHTANVASTSGSSSNLKAFMLTPSSLTSVVVGDDLPRDVSQVSDQTLDVGNHEQDQDLDHDHSIIVPDQILNDLQPDASLQTRSFAHGVDYSKGFSSDLPSLEHKPDVCPVFLGLKQVAQEGFKIPLIQVAAAVGAVVGQCNVDGVQLMCSG